MLGPSDRQILEEASAETRKRWWCHLSRGEMPAALRDVGPNTQGRRRDLLRWIMQRVPTPELVDYWRDGRWYDVTKHKEN